MAFLGSLGLVFYGVAIPALLFRRLKKESQDEAEQRFDPDFMESHGWLVRSPRPRTSLLSPTDRLSIQVGCLAGAALQARALVV